MARHARIGMLGLGLVATVAGGEPPFGALKGLHGSGPYGLMRAVDLDVDGKDELLVENGLGHLVLIEARQRSEPKELERVISVAQADLRDVAVGDLDRDGVLEIVSAGDDAIRWHQRVGIDDLGGGGQVSSGWRTHELGVGAGASAVALGDIDRDGDLDCVAPDASGLDLVWYRTSLGDGAPRQSIVFEEGFSFALGARPIALETADVNRDGWLDVVSLSARGLGVHLREPGLDSFTSLFVDLGMAEVRDLMLHDGEGDGDLDALVVGDDRASLAVNMDGSGGDWVVEDIMGGLDAPRRGFVTDLDADGVVDYVIEGGGQAVVWLAEALAIESVLYNFAIRTYGPIAITDFDGDGDQDFIGGLSSGPLVWRENLLVHRSDALPRRSDITSEAGGAFNVAAGDLDGDGDADLAVAAFVDDAIEWHENLGGGVFLEHTVFEGANGPVQVVFADIDMDGRLDIASCSTNDDSIRWHRNLGGTPPTFATSVVSTDADGVFSIGVGDMDRDGRVDLVSAEKNAHRVRWFRNLDVEGQVGFGAAIVKNGVRGAFNVRVADIDGDAWPDVVSASRDDDTIRVLRSMGGDLSSFQTIVLTSRADHAACVDVADMDGDGDLDVLGASRDDAKIRWFENDGASPPTFVERLVDGGVLGASWVRAADLDADGDMDIAVAARELGLVHVFTSDGAQTPSFAGRALNTPATLLSCVEASDLDRDGRMDLAVAAVTEGLVAWYRNEGGSFAMDAAPIAPAQLPAWGVAGVLRLDGASRARAGGNDVLVQSVTLRFEDEAGEALSTEELGNLVQLLSVHEDDGDGEFDSLLDSRVLEMEQIVLSDGEIAIEFPEGSRVFGAGSSRTMFVAVRLGEGAGNQTPHSFKVVHVGTDVTDGRNGSAIAVEDPREVGTELIEATCPADMTGSDDPDDPGFGRPDGRIDQMDYSYYTALHDAGDPMADLTSAGGRTDPSYAIPDGVVDTEDLFFFLDRFSEGC